MLLSRVPSSPFFSLTVFIVLFAGKRITNLIKSYTVNSINLTISQEIENIVKELKELEKTNNKPSK